MKNCSTALMGSLLIWGILTGCEKKTGNLISEPVADYWNLQVGKYVRYTLDSTRYVNFGQNDTVIHYQAKDVVEGTMTDNSGRHGYRIVRYLRDAASTSEADWRASLAYQVIPGNSTIELVESNFRYIKLVQPIRNGFNWRGNGFLPTEPYKDLYGFSNDQDMQTWDYTYQDVGALLTINNTSYDSTISILQIADSINLDIPGAPQSKTYWMEKYAKNIGLVYKEVIMWEAQPPLGSQVGYRHGFGIRMAILDHN